MPFNPSDNRYEHLRIVAEEINPDRRRNPSVPPQAPNRGTRSAFAGQLTKRLDQMKDEVVHRPPPPPGVQPHLVFRVPLAPKASAQGVADTLIRAGISILGIEGDKAIIAFHDDASLQSLRQGVSDYAAGPRINPQTNQPYASTSWDVLEFIEAAQMRRWGPRDRIGKRLAEAIGDEGQSIDPAATYVVDVEFWHRGTRTLANAALTELRAMIVHQNTAGDRVRDTFCGDTLCLARVSVNGLKLRSLLEMDLVAEAESPPTPVFDPVMAKNLTPKDFPEPPKPPADGPRVCIVDSGVASNHPLLKNNIGHAIAVLTPEASAEDGYGHGTMVAGLSVFGNVRACYEQGVFNSIVTLFSARVLNDQNQFDDEKLIIHQMRQAIEYFTSPPFDCRVFNMSLGVGEPWLRDNRRQSIWAETLDILARELSVIIVVSAGNHKLGWAGTTSDAEETLSEYPDYLFQPECGLCEPATAAIPITVGSIAEYIEPSVQRGVRAENLNQAIAEVGQPTPITRIGPGLNGAIKPEFVAPGGNILFEGQMDARRAVDDHPGVSVMSLAHRHLEGMFGYGSATSYAAPRVAYSAARAWHSLQQYLGEDPHPNLVRAILAAAAEVPSSLTELIQPEHGSEGVQRVCGYGLIDDDFLLHSGNSRVTLIAQAAVRIDSFLVFEVPVPVEFRRAEGDKRVIVSLAYDPPVRRRRAEYLGVELWFALIRGKTRDEVVGAYRAVTSDERDAAKRAQQKLQGAFKSPYRCQLKPCPTSLAASTLQRAEWTFKREGNDYGDPWYLVVRADRNWAPATVTEQSFALTITLEAKEEHLYALLQNRIRARQQQRARVRT